MTCDKLLSLAHFVHGRITDWWQERQLLLCRGAGQRVLQNQSSITFGGEDDGAAPATDLPSARRRNANAQTSDEQVFNR